ncbi:MAG: N-formylglutamate deformylase [Gammaproteobacteria bacterium]|nr:MAG: N-formylglutamate deformylase [Gammaproteobacteria bacterium]
MTSGFALHQGDAPLLISVPHDGRELPPDIAARMSEAGRSLTDTDWHVRRLYEFAQCMGASILSANYSRYVVDLNRSPADEALYEGQLATGLCPARTFAGAALYRDGASVSAAEQRLRTEEYWQPYHDQLAACLGALRERHGYALLWDAHSIRAAVPALFEGTLPDLNIGTHDGASCAVEIEAALLQVAGGSQYSSVLNGRFKGGYITRHYGAPAQGIHAVQLELAQHCYMDEDSLRYDETSARKLAQLIRALLQALLDISAASFSSASGRCP